MRHSLRGRLILVATVVLAIFLFLSGLALDRAFQQSLSSSERIYLQELIYGLLADAELAAPDQLEFPERLSESRFALPGSGLYALAHNKAGTRIWRSPSWLGVPGTEDIPHYKDTERFESIRLSGKAYFALSNNIDWEVEGGNEYALTFTVVEDQNRFATQLKTFRRSLITWLGAAALVLLIVQLLVTHWGLRPIKQIAQEVLRAERGETDRISEDYPIELQPLAQNVNEFIEKEREHINRYRNTLGDLAHSLKTPLAVMRSLLEEPLKDQTQNTERHAINEQVERMANIIEHQLQRATTTGKSVMLAPVAVNGVVDKIIASLNKVYAGRKIQTNLSLEESLKFYGEEGDLYEILGNVLDNAYKWSYANISVNGSAIKVVGLNRTGINIQIVDDGPGIAADQIDEVLQRGARSPSAKGEFGIGLATVGDIVNSYGGELKLSNAENAGLKVEIQIAPSRA